jgi:hypothetical protein
MGYCGRCGAPLAPGARFCGRCGTPVLVQAAVAAPVYGYAPAPRAAYPTAAQGRLAAPLIAGGLVAILLVVAIVVGAIAVSQAARGGHSTCTSHCPPKFVTPLAEQASYTSSVYKFTVNYSSRWTLRDQSGTGVILGTRVGSVQVMGSSGQDPGQALQASLRALPSSTWQDLTPVAALKGAHIGDVEGVGEVYAANLVGTSQTATKVRVAVIAAAKGPVTVVIVATDPVDTKSSPTGFPEAQVIDYMCTEFAWGA